MLTLRYFLAGRSVWFTVNAVTSVNSDGCGVQRIFRNERLSWLRGDLNIQPPVPNDQGQEIQVLRLVSLTNQRAILSKRDSEVVPNFYRCPDVVDAIEL